MLSYQTMLKNEFVRRKRKNTAYSLRSFARDLQLSQPFLTQILNDRRRLGVTKAVGIAHRLKFPKTERVLFLNLVRLSATRDPQARNLIQEEIGDLLRSRVQFRTLREDQFAMVADWYHFAILELTELPDFRLDANWISQRLNLSEEKATAALERLQRSGLLVKKGQSWRKAESDYIFADVSSAAIRWHHQQSLELARRALEEQSMSEREFFAVTLPIDPQQMAQAKKAIREFSESFTARMQAGSKRAVYKLAIQFFRLDSRAGTTSKKGGV